MPPSDADSFGRVQAQCSRFEHQWQEGGRPRIDEFLSAVSESEQQSLLRELLLLEWVGRRQRCEAFDREEYADRYPTRRDIVETAWGQWQRWLQAADVSPRP